MYCTPTYFENKLIEVDWSAVEFMLYSTYICVFREIPLTDTGIPLFFSAYILKYTILFLSEKWVCLQKGDFYFFPSRFFFLKI